MTIPLPGLPLHAQREAVEELERLGYTDLWTQETGGSDAFTPLALAAAWTREARLGTAIAQVPTRGPATLAMHAAALADAAPGRFVLGIGSSSPAIVRDWNDLPFERPRSRTRDTLRFLRRALAGERVSESYETFRVRGFRLERAPDVAPPIYVAALRERMLGLASAEADGVILGLLTAGDVARVRKHVDPERDVVLRLAVCPIDDPARARAIGRRMLARYLNVPTYARFHDWLGRGELLAPMREAWRAGDREAAERALPDELVDALFIHGPPAACREQIERFVAAGVRTPIVGLFVPDGDLRSAVRALAPTSAMGSGPSRSG